MNENKWLLLGGLVLAAAMSVAIGVGAMRASGSTNAVKPSTGAVSLEVRPVDGGRYVVNVAAQAQVAAQTRVCADLYGEKPVKGEYLFGACTTTGFAGGHSITFTLPASVLNAQDEIYATVSFPDAPPVVLTSDAVVVKNSASTGAMASGETS